MKLKLSFFQPTAKNTVTAVTTVTPADDAGCIGNQNKNAPVTTVTNNETVTAVTEAKKARLPIEPANNAEVTAVTEVTAKNTIPENVLQATAPETAAKLQTAGAIQDSPAMPEHTSAEANAAQATPAQQPANSAGRLAAWERGEWVTIPHTAEALEIHQAIEIEQIARRRRLFVVAEELSKALNTIDRIDRDQRPDDYNFALSALRSRVEDARPWLARGST